MDIRKKYTIPYKGLSIGNHAFEFHVGDDFFAAFENAEIKKGNADVRVNIEKQNHMLSLHFDIDGSVEAECDRCLENFDLPFTYEGDLHVRFSETENESDGEIMWISPNETELNLAQYIYDSINLSLPYQRVHPEDANGNSSCNPDMLARFRIVSEEEFDRLAQQAEKGAESPNGEETEGGEETENPWKKLAELKKQMENEE